MSQLDLPDACILIERSITNRAHESTLPSETPLSLLIDTDPALGLPLSDIDDALAIHYLVRAGVAIRGLTTCFGNGSGPDVTRIAAHLGTAYGLEVFPGAHAPTDTDTAAVDALLAHRGDVLALAPLTNVAAALRRGARWSRLIVLGGSARRAPNLRPLYTTEFNFALDLAAARDVLPHATIVFPMEICRQVLFTQNQLSHLPAWIRARCTHWTRLAPLLTLRPGFHPWDLLPAVWLTHPEIFTYRTAAVELDPSPVRRGHIRTSNGETTQIAVSVDALHLRQIWTTCTES